MFKTNETDREFSNLLKINYVKLDMDHLEQKKFIPLRVNFNLRVEREMFVPSLKSVLKQKSYYDLPGQIEKSALRKQRILQSQSSPRIRPTIETSDITMSTRRIDQSVKSAQSSRRLVSPERKPLRDFIKYNVQ